MTPINGLNADESSPTYCLLVECTYA